MVAGRGSATADALSNPPPQYWGLPSGGVCGYGERDDLRPWFRSCRGLVFSNSLRHPGSGPLDEGEPRISCLYPPPPLPGDSSGLQWQCVRLLFCLRCLSVLRPVMPLSPPSLLATVRAGSVIRDGVVGTIGVGTAPFDVAVTPDGATVYTANAFGDSVSVIRDTVVTDTIVVGANPYGVAVAPDGTVYTTNFNGNSVSRIAFESAGTVPTLTGTPPTPVVGQPYTYSFTVTGDPAPAVTVRSGELPPGLALTASGELTGTPTAAGTYAAVLTAANAAGSRDLDITVTGSNSRIPSKRKVSREIRAITVRSTSWSSGAGSKVNLTSHLAPKSEPNTYILRMLFDSRCYFACE